MASPLPVAQYMTRAPCAAVPEQSLGSARRLMEEHAIRHLPVQAQGKLVGILSDRDLQLVWTLAHAPPEALTVEDAMTPDPYTVPPNAPLDHVVRTMADRKIGSAVVVERGRIVGVFTSTDAMHALADLLGARWMTADVDGPIRTHSVQDRVRASPRSPASAFPLVEHCVLHRAEPASVFGRAELLRRIEDLLHVDTARAEAIVRAVLAGVKRVLPERAVVDAESQLPYELLELWER